MKNPTKNEKLKVLTSSQVGIGSFVVGGVFVYLIFSNLQLVGITIGMITAFVGYKNIKIAQDKLDLDQENNRRNLSILESKQTQGYFILNRRLSKLKPCPAMR